MQIAVVMRDSTAIGGAVLTLVSRPSYMARGDRDGRPAFDGPARIIDIGCVVVAGDFAPNGPIQPENG